ncbi:MAG: pseudouridine synthase [Pseudomonadota bacterium]
MDPEVLRAIDARLHTLETKGAVDEVHRSNVENRLSGIEDTQKWLVRLILGAWIMSAVAYAIKGGFVLG